jgi:hypothetical protein
MNPEVKIYRVLIRGVVYLLLFSIGDGYSTQQDWQEWAHRMPNTLTHRQQPETSILPIDVTFSVPADSCTHPQKELRLILQTKTGLREIPFQLSHLTRWTRDTDDTESRPTISGLLTFFDVATGTDNGRYYLLCGNPDALAPPYSTDLSVQGATPAWSITNSKFTVDLHSSGQLAAVRLEDRPETPIAPQTGFLHWNPGIFIPART